MEHKRPTRLLIGWLDWNIVWWDRQAWENQEDRERPWGTCDPGNRRISIRADLEPHSLACCFAHEVAHAVARQYGVYDTAVTPERAADMASYWMVGFWRANQDAFRWWVEVVLSEEPLQAQSMEE